MRPSTRAVWAIFEALSNAVVLMDQGHLPSRAPNWRHEAAFHRDIKPANGKRDIIIRSIGTDMLQFSSQSHKETRGHGYLQPSMSLPTESTFLGRRADCDRLGDYDLAIWTARPGSSLPGVGTPSYMAPVRRGRVESLDLNLADTTLGSSRVRARPGQCTCSSSHFQLTIRCVVSWSHRDVLDEPRTRLDRRRPRGHDG